MLKTHEHTCQKFNWTSRFIILSTVNDYSHCFCISYLLKIIGWYNEIRYIFYSNWCGHGHIFHTFLNLGCFRGLLRWLLSQVPLSYRIWWFMFQCIKCISTFHSGYKKRSEMVLILFHQPCVAWFILMHRTYQNYISVMTKTLNSSLLFSFCGFKDKLSILHGKMIKIIIMLVKGKWWFQSRILCFRLL